MARANEKNKKVKKQSGPSVDAENVLETDQRILARLTLFSLFLFFGVCAQARTKEYILKSGVKKDQHMHSIRGASIDNNATQQ